LDPGAVPGASTKNRPGTDYPDRLLMGAKQDRQGRKDRTFARHRYRRYRVTSVRCKRQQR